MKHTIIAATILVIHGLTSPVLLAQRVVSADDVHELTCNYLACGPGNSGLHFLADNGNVFALRESGLSHIGRIGIANGMRLSSAVYIDSSSWLYTLRDSPVLYYWKSGQFADSVMTPDQSYIFEIRVFGSTIVVRTSSGIALCTSLESMNMGTELAPFTVFAVAPFSQGVHVIGIDSMKTYTNINGTYTAEATSALSFVSPPISSVATTDGSQMFVMTVSTIKMYCLYQISNDRQPRLIDSSLHPFALSSRANSIAAVSTDGIWTIRDSVLSLVPVSLGDSEVFEFLPLSLYESDTSFTIAGAHSFVAELSFAHGWTVISYLPRKPGSGSTVLTELDRVAGLRVGARKTVVAPRRTVFEWAPIPIRGSCVEPSASVARQAFIGGGELMTTWHLVNSSITFSPIGRDTVVCSASVIRPDLWTESERGDLYGLRASPNDSFIQKSTDRGRTWNRYCPSQGPNNLASFILAREDSIWIFDSGLGRDSLDTTIYRTQSFLLIKLFKNGVLQSEKRFHTISSLHSSHMRDGKLYAIMRSNLVATGPVRSFGYIDLHSLTVTTLYSDESNVLNAFAFIGKYAVFADLSGNLLSYYTGIADSTMQLIGRGLGFGAIEQLYALNDTTALLLSASTPPSVYAVYLPNQTTDVQEEDPYQNLRIAAIDDVSPNPSSSEFKVRLTVANGWPISDVTIVGTSVLGQQMFSQPLSLLTSATSNGSVLEIVIPCHTWPTGSYILSARSSRGRHSRVVVKL